MDNAMTAGAARVTPLAGEDLERMCEDFRALRRDRGPESADVAWAGGAMAEWLGILRSAGGALTSRGAAVLTVGMRETLAIRDALIISILCERVRREELLELIAQPHLPDNARKIGDILNHAFRDPRCQPSRERCVAGMRALRGIIAAAPLEYQVQPMAVVAYIRWWIGDGDASQIAMRCLDIDASCTLAAIVLAAIAHGVAPAWQT